MNKRIKDILEYAIIIIAVILFRTFLYSPIRVSGASMVPTLNNGDIMILDKIGYRTKGLDRFDIVVIKYEKEKIIKRVIGLPGDYIQYENDKLYVNGEYVDEPFDRKEMDDFTLEDLGENIIPEGKYLVLGDNRPVSKDSRVLGNFTKEDIIGKVRIRIFPFNKIGKID